MYKRSAFHSLNDLTDSDNVEAFTVSPLAGVMQRVSLLYLHDVLH